VIGGLVAKAGATGTTGSVVVIPLPPLSVADTTS
jgi:hypothetical protein